MEIMQTWTTIFKNNIYGLLPPTEDLFDETVFYVSDGIGTATKSLFDETVFYVSDGIGTTYNTLRFRKISLETGEELANVLARDWTRCICADKESIYAVLDKRILKLNRKDLSIVEKYIKNIPRYSACVDFISEDVLILMSESGKTIQQFDLQMQKSSRKKIDNDDILLDIIKADADTFFIFKERAVYQYSPKVSTVKKLLDTEPCIRCAMDSTGGTYLLCREPVRKLCSSKILVYSSLMENDFEELIPGCIANQFWISEEKQQLYMTRDSEMWIYSIDERKLLFHHTFGTGYVYGVFVHTNSVLTYNEADHCLTCYKIE